MYIDALHVCLLNLDILKLDHWISLLRLGKEICHAPTDADVGDRSREFSRFRLNVLRAMLVLGRP
jgi:hypothetical protein